GYDARPHAPDSYPPADPNSSSEAGLERDTPPRNRSNWRPPGPRARRQGKRGVEVGRARRSAQKSTARHHQMLRPPVPPWDMGWPSDGTDFLDDGLDASAVTPDYGGVPFRT